MRRRPWALFVRGYTPGGAMDEKEFKKHLQDLVHGHHHPEEHEWSEGGQARPKPPAPTKTAKRATRKRKAPSK